MPKTFANPTYDTAFKRLFGNSNHPDLTKNFLNTVLNRNSENLISEIVFVNTEKTPRFNREKKTYIDIQCKDVSGHEFIIEMQSAKESFFEKRVQYYVAHALSRQLEKNQLYPELKPVIFIGVLGFNLSKPHTKNALPSSVMTHHLITNQETGQQDLNLMEFHFIELPKFKKTEKQLETEIDRWLYFFKKAGQLDDIPKSCAQSANVKEAFDVMERANWDVKAWEKYEEERKLEIYFATQEYAEQERKKQEEENSKKIEQLESQIQQSEQKAIQDKEKAIQEAKTQAMQEKEQTALHFLRMGIAIEQIAQGTGLTIEQIKKLQNQ